MAQLYTIDVHKDTHRSHPYISDLLVVWALGGIAMPLIHTGTIVQDSGIADLEGLFDIRIQYQGYVTVALTGELPELIAVQVFSGTAPDPQYPNPQSVGPEGAKLPMFRFLQAEFSLFAERAGDWVKTNISTDRHSWPPIVNFCRVVRNAIAHGGVINIPSAASPEVEWRGIHYSYVDSGSQLMKPDGKMNWGDLILLMCELDEELTGLNAPVPLP